MTMVNTLEREWLLLILTPATLSVTKADTMDSAIKESAPIHWEPNFVTHEEPSALASVHSKTDSSNQLVNGWLSLLGDKLYLIRSVEDIFFTIEGNNVDVWVVIPQRDLDVLHQIVESEWELAKILVTGENPPFLVDFHVIYRYDRNVQDLAPTRAIRLPR